MRGRGSGGGGGGRCRGQKLRWMDECTAKSRGLIVGLSQQMIGVGFIVSTWYVCRASSRDNSVWGC